MSDVPKAEAIDAVEPLIYHGNGLVREEKPQAAIPYFQRALTLSERDEQRFDGHLGLGKCYEQLENAMLAAKHYEQAAALDPLPLAALVPLAGVWLRTGEKDRALPYLRQVLQLFHDRVLAQDEERVQWALHWLEEAGSLCLDHDLPTQALALSYAAFAASLEAERPADFSHDLQYQLAIAWDRVDNKAMTIRHLEQVVAQATTWIAFTDYYRYLALTYAEVGQLRRAIRCMERAIAIMQAFYQKQNVAVEGKELYQTLQRQLADLRAQAPGLWGHIWAEVTYQQRAGRLLPLLEPLSAAAWKRMLRWLLVALVAGVVVGYWIGSIRFALIGAIVLVLIGSCVGYWRGLRLRRTKPAFP